MAAEEYLVIFIIVQNFFGIAAVVLILRKFKYFARLAGKCLFTPLFGVLWV